MSKKLDADLTIEAVEATIRILTESEFTRDEALQLILSQIAVQVNPEIMRLGVALCEKHHEDFAKAEWSGNGDLAPRTLGSVEYALGPLQFCDFSHCKLLQNQTLGKPQVSDQWQ